MEHSIYSGPGDMVALCKLAETLAALPFLQDGGPIKNKCSTSDVATFEFRPAHAGANSLDDQASL